MKYFCPKCKEEQLLPVGPCSRCGMPYRPKLMGTIECLHRRELKTVPLREVSGNNPVYLPTLQDKKYDTEICSKCGKCYLMVLV